MPVGRQGGRKGKRSARRRVRRAGEEGCKKGWNEEGRRRYKGERAQKKGTFASSITKSPCVHLACALRVSPCGQGRRPLKLYTTNSVLPIYWSKHVVDYVL